MYNPNNLSKQLKEQSEDLNPYQYKNEADGHFISPGMYESLLAQCRCGRPHSDLHLLRCVQKQQPKHEYMPMEGVTVGNLEENKGGDSKIQLPKTSSKFVGWQKSTPKYQQWERSMKYYSPVYDMPGERITTTPYNVIYIE